MVQSTSLIVAVATAATVLYAANPALGAAIHVRRDDQMDLVSRGTDKDSKSVSHGHGATWWHKLFEEKSKDFQRVLKVFELYIKKGSDTEKKKILKQLATAGKKGDKEDKKDAKKDESKSFKASKEKASKDKASKDKTNDKKTRRDLQDEYVTRDLEDDDLFARDFDDVNLFAREFDQDELLARELDDELVSREIYEGLSELEGRDFDDDLFERSDVYDDLD